MIKKTLKKICRYIYTIGMFEHIKVLNIEKNNFLNSNAIFDFTSKIGESANIINSQNNKSKISIGHKSRIDGELLVFKHGGEICIGDYCYVGLQSRMWSAKKISIGNRVLIAHNVNIHDNISHPLDSKIRHLDYINYTEKGLLEYPDLLEAEIVIEDDVWIGFGSTILKGVTIGKGAIIGANSVITKDVPPYAVIVGNPAQIKKYTT